MEGVLLGAGWGALSLFVLARFRPQPSRLRALSGKAEGGVGGSSVGSSEKKREAPPVERLGQLVYGTFARLRYRRRGGWAGGTSATLCDPLRARRLGGVVAAALAFIALLPQAVPAAMVGAWALPGLSARRAERRRLASLADGLPEVVDLLVLAVGSGLNVPLALAAVVRRASGPLAYELRRVVEEASLGRRLAEALDDLPARAGESTRPLVAALVASERYGAPLASSLDRLADEVRRQRQRRAEEAVRRVPVKLLFPLIFCTLPAFALLTVAPLIVSAVRSLHL